jgi:hypothetical protein
VTLDDRDEFGARLLGLGLRALAGHQGQQRHNASIHDGGARMSQWEIEDEGEIHPEGPIEWIDARLVGGALSVAVTDGPPRIVVGSVHGGPVVITDGANGVRIHHRSQTAHTDPWSHHDPVGGIVESILSGLRGAFSWFGGRSADVSILVPSPVRVVAHTTSADVLVSGVTESKIETVSGALTACGVTGWLQLKTVSGDIAAAHVSGRLWVRTVSGEVTVARANLSELHAKSVSGDVLVDADLSAGSHSLRGVSADMLIRVDPNEGMDLDATTVSGALACAIGEPYEESRPGARRLRMQTGDGGARLICHTVSGDLTVVGRADAA